MSNLKKNIVFYLGVFVALLILGKQARDFYLSLKNENKRLHAELVNTKDAYEQLSETAAKLEIQYVEQRDLNAKLKSDFSNEREVLTGRIKLLSNATYLIRENARNSGKSDFVYQGATTKYILNELRYNDGPPIGYVLIFDDGRVTSKIYNHQLIAKTALSRDEESGKYVVVSKMDYVLKSPSLNLNGEKVWFNQPYALNIVGGTALVDPTENNLNRKRFQWFTPKLNAGFSIPGTTINPGLSVSVSGFGRTKNDLDFKFLDLGLNLNSDNKIRPSVIPVLWRPFSGLISNTYIGPGVEFSEVGPVYNISIKLGL